MAAQKTTKAKASSVPTKKTWTPADNRSYASPVSYGVDHNGTVTTKPARP